MNSERDYWLVIEAYVYINITNKGVLLYNTLDGRSVESNHVEIINILYEMQGKPNGSIFLLSRKHLKEDVIVRFIAEIRDKYIGDIIDVSLSYGKPVQVLPYFNYPDHRNKRIKISSLENLLQALLEVHLHLDIETDNKQLRLFLTSLPAQVAFEITVDRDIIELNKDLFMLLKERNVSKSINCNYVNIPLFDDGRLTDFNYKISVIFPVDKQQFERSLKAVLKSNCHAEFIFNVSSLSDCQEAEHIIESCHIKDYRLKPVYTGANLSFFKENIYLSKEDILSTRLTMKDIFRKRTINCYDFGKLHVFSNGDVYANTLHPSLGNINTHTIHDLIQKELSDGNSWLRIREEEPCNNCLYQYICPSPSDYEIQIGKPNLCKIFNNI